uniref:ribose-phosphate diphosphokinase n=1 Tax=Ignisphaera aggregans TaxID=334771 RepID=A0A7C2ZPL3_9CREN
MIVCLSGTPKSMLEGLARECHRKVYTPFRKIFPDGEQYVRFDYEDTLDGVYIVQSMFPDQDKKVVELYLSLEALLGLGARIDGLVLLYTAYARQDKRFIRGEPISVKAIYQGLKLLGVSKIITIDVHSLQPFIDMGFNVINILPHGYMIARAGLKIDMVLAPDKGAIARAEKAAKMIGVPYDHLDKFRDRVTGEISIDAKALDVKGKNIVIVDDIISTGKTVAKSAELLYKAGAERVYVAVSHALVSNETVDILSKAGIAKMLIANTIEQKISLPNWIEVVDISRKLCEVL